MAKRANKETPLVETPLVETPWTEMTKAFWVKKQSCQQFQQGLERGLGR